MISIAALISWPDCLNRHYLDSYGTIRGLFAEDTSQEVLDLPTRLYRLRLHTIGATVD